MNPAQLNASRRNELDSLLVLVQQEQSATHILFLAWKKAAPEGATPLNPGIREVELALPWAFLGGSSMGPVMP